MLRLFTHNLAFAATLLATPAFAIMLDGTLDAPNNLTLRATQNSPTSFGNATVGGQDSAGSELNQLFANVIDGTLTITLTGNLEANFNKAWIFIDAVAGGENQLQGGNADGGFGEINSLAGLTFANGATMDHGIRLEVGGGFYGVNQFDLQANTGGSVASGGGAADFPVSDGGTGAIRFGWNNSNIVGVLGDDTSMNVPADAATATTGWEFEIDLLDAYGGSQGDIQIAAFITNGGGNFISNQVLPGVGFNSSTNLGGTPSTVTIGTVTVPGPLLGAIPGDVDGDGDVDFIETDGDMISDFDIIRANFLNLTTLRGEGNLVNFGDSTGIVDIADFREWKDNYPGTPSELLAAFNLLTGNNSVPEPASIALIIGACIVASFVPRRGR